MKRENVVILAVAPFCGLNAALRGSRYTVSLWYWCAASLVVGALIFFGFNIWNIEAIESEHLGQATFSGAYAVMSLPTMLQAFATFRWFPLYILFFVIGCAVYAKGFRVNLLALLPLVLLISYLCVYAFHYRSYDAVQLGRISRFEVLRYMTNYFAFIALIGGSGLGHLGKFFQKRNNHGIRSLNQVLAVSVAIYVCLCLWIGHGLRCDLSQEEHQRRIQPVLQTIDVVGGSKAIIITDIPVVFQVFAPDDMVVIDAYSIGSAVTEETTRRMMRSASNTYWLKLDDRLVGTDRTRFPSFFRFIEELETEQLWRLSREYSLHRVHLQ
jgi:hypothetical protein